MPVETLVVGQLSTNCYLFYDEDSRQCFIIDPGDDGDYIIRKIKDLDLKPQAILATHGHFDHVLAAAELKLAFDIPFYLNAKDAKILKRTQSTAKYFTSLEVDPVLMPDKFLSDGQELKIENCKLKILFTPGHTPGSVTFLYADRHTKKYQVQAKCQAFVGDLIFAHGGYGRTDLKGGDMNKLQQSIKKILAFPSETILYSGHGDLTSVKKEKKFYG